MISWPGNRWPRFPHPKKDELLSSWLERTAIANGTKAHLLAKRSNLIANGKPLRNIDFVPQKESLNLLSQFTGCNIEVLWQSTLSEYLGHISVDNLKSNRNLLLLGLANQKNKRFYLQFCPVCLKQAEYFRRIWRLSYMVCCPYHGVTLYDRCHVCGAPVNIFGNDEKSRREAYFGSLVTCWSCGSSLTSAPAVQVERHLCDFSLQLAEAIPSGIISVGDDGQWIYLCSYLRALRQFCHALLKSQNIIHHNYIYDMDTLPHEIRMRLLNRLVEGLRGDLEGLITLFRELGITQHMLSSLERNNGPLPFWFLSNLLPYLKSGYIFGTDDQVKQAIALMQSRGLKINPYSVNRFMGTVDSCVVKRVVRDLK